MNRLTYWERTRWSLAPEGKSWRMRRRRSIMISKSTPEPFILQSQRRGQGGPIECHARPLCPFQRSLAIGQGGKEAGWVGKYLKRHDVSEAK